jgi:hypothetical protein
MYYHPGRFPDSENRRNGQSRSFIHNSDGDTMKRANSVADFNLNGSVLQWAFPHGTKLEIDAQSFFTEWATFDEVQQNIIRNGLKQKCADGMASCATEADRIERMGGIMQNLLNGVWSSRGTGTASDAAVLAQAIADVDRKPLAKVRVYVDTLSKASRDALMAHPLYKQAVDDIKANRAAAVDVDDLIAGIESI